ncbi:D-tagatose-1,6-bisphosphate aldolase subunit KbaY, partial [Yersinia pestis PY-64]
MKQRLKWLFP